MRKIVYAFIFALGIGFAGVSAASAAPVPSHTGAAVAGSGVQQVHYWRHCERLRDACIYREERGEVGEGNCRRYREECGPRGYSYCQRLRDACRYKEERGEVGEGNCRRYLDECRSR